ncbi:MAG: hypothetical protein OXP66_19390 [Candidatus Tectomicrobia bacterium]|nr:hypothetical protein [Candidatus Tectomicrobia bacterium]
MTDRRTVLGRARATGDSAPAVSPSVVVGLNAVIVAVTEEVPRVLTVSRIDRSLPGARQADALPYGPLRPEQHQTLERGLRDWAWQQTGTRLGYVEQLYTFGDRIRDPRAGQGGPWTISVAYLALVREQHLAGSREAHWRDWYDYFPWEDWRWGQPALISRVIAPALDNWLARSSKKAGIRARQDRRDIVFGLNRTPWDAERVLERYELLYEAKLVGESVGEAGQSGTAELGRPMVMDHRRILATALGRLRGKIKYRPVVFELLPPVFTLSRLQRVVEALAGTRLHKQNFRRLVDHGGLVEGTGKFDEETGGRPAELFSFRHEVLRERAAPGVRLPGFQSRV